MILNAPKRTIHPFLSEIMAHTSRSKSKMIVLALIPARAHSKRLPGKNLRKFCGKPLIAWSIQAAKSCSLIDRVIVSTEDPKLAEIARKWGADTPFLRPKKLSTDSASSMDVVLHAIARLEKDGKHYDAIVLLQPTSPLRTSKHLTEAISLFANKKANAVVSVATGAHSPYWTNRLTSKGSMSFFLRSLAAEPRNFRSPWYCLNGAIYIGRTSFLKERRDWYSDTTYAYKMPARDSCDIDTHDDFLMAELLMRHELRSAQSVKPL